MQSSVRNFPAPLYSSHPFFVKAPLAFHAAFTTCSTQPELHRLLSDYEPTLVIRDAGRSAREDIQFLHLLGSRLAVLDDSGDGTATRKARRHLTS